MLEKFEVYNFMGFKDNLVFDFHTSKKYTYNTDLVQTSILKKALVFGEYSSGKSNLCCALTEIAPMQFSSITLSLTEKVCSMNTQKNLRTNCAMKSFITEMSLYWNIIISTFHIQL